MQYTFEFNITKHYLGIYNTERQVCLDPSANVVLNHSSTYKEPGDIYCGVD